jgi:hypothetical protein
MADQRIFNEAVFRAAVTRFEVNSDPASAQRIVTGVGQVLRMLDAARSELDETTEALNEAMRVGDEVQAERDHLTKQVERVREVAVYFRDREADLKRRYDQATNDAQSTALLSSAALTGDAAHRIERALGGTEAGR